MARNRFWRKGIATAPRRNAPVLADSGIADAALSGPARRVNRLVAVIAAVGACGTVALAVTLTPGAQTSASSASAYQGDLAISRIEPVPAPQAVVAPQAVAAAPVEATAHTTVVASRPEPAPKSDRLDVERQTFQFQQPDQRDDSDLRGAVRDEAGERDVASLSDEPAAEPTAVRATADSAERKLDADDLEADADDLRSLEFGLSEPPPPGDTSAAVGAEDMDEANSDEANSDEANSDEANSDEASSESVDDASEDAAGEIADDSSDVATEDAGEADIEAVVETAVERAAPEQAAPEQAEPEQAEPEVAATRTAPVRTDVNMRAGPSNGAAVIQVVPGESNVEVIGCDYWCEVLYDGRRGYIYKGFVRGS